MVRLADIVKIALDELRMQMLGSQVLFGFQMHAAFQPGFDKLSSTAKTAEVLAAVLIVTAMGLVIAGPAQHRLVDRGNATNRILRVSARLANAALAPFALTIGCDVFVVGERHWGASTAWLAALAATALAVLLWYGLGNLLRLRFHPKDVPMPDEKHTDLHDRIEQMLTEARVVLPGAQALLGFQFVVTLSEAFEHLSAADKTVHFLSLGATALAIMILIAPAAVHRLTFRGLDIERFHRIGSLLVTIALVPVALGISGDLYVILNHVLRDGAAAASIAGVMLLGLLTLWYAVPLALRKPTP